LVIHAAVMLFYLLLAVIITYPLVSVLATRFAGHPFSDSYELARHIWWLGHALKTGQPVYAQPLLGYPDGLDGALLWSFPLQSFPAWLFSLFMPLPAAFNLSLLIRLALNGWSAFVLARRLTGQRWPALLAGAVFMAYPTVQGHLAAGHTGLLALWPVPLYACALLYLRDTGATRWLIPAALLFMLSAWGSTQMVIFTTAPVTLVFALSLIWQRNWRALAHLAVVVALGSLLALIFALPGLLSASREPAYMRLTTGVVDYSADLLAIFAPSFMHPLHRDNTLAASILGIDPFENATYIGLVAGVLALIGAATRRRARWWLLLALLAWIMSLGPLLKAGGELVSVVIDDYSTRIVLPWAAIYDLPIIRITRTPGRFNFTLALAVAMMAAYGARWLASRLNHRRAGPATLILIALILYDYQFWWNASGTLPDLPTVEGIVPEPVRALSTRDDIRAVFDVPWQHPLAAKAGLWLQTGHQRPLIAGHIARQTPIDPAKLTILQATFDPALLDATGADVIILHREWDDEAGVLEATLHDRFGPPLYEDERFAVFDVPEPDGAPGFVALPLSEMTLHDRLETYVYTPNETQIEIAVEYSGDTQTVTLELDEQPVTFWRAEGHGVLEVPPTLPAGYHRLALSLTPACPPQAPEPLECNAVIIHRLEAAPATD